tara:strand:+ start:1635 stop:2603 length:969 start_codon:yes stop_codon:yes gene_type:complete
MARTFSALNPANSFNYWNGYGHYNTYGGAFGNKETANLADGKSIDQMELFSNLYYNLLGFDYEYKFEYTNSENDNEFNVRETGTVSFNGLTEIAVVAPWLGSGQDNLVGYKVSPYGDDQGDPFIRYAWNAKGRKQVSFYDSFGPNSSGSFVGQGSNYFREGSDVTPGNGQRNLFMPTRADSIQGATGNSNGFMGVHFAPGSGSPFGFGSMGIVFCGGVDEMSDKAEGYVGSYDFKAHYTNVAGVPCYVVSYVNGYSESETYSDGYYENSVFRQGANEARTIKFTETHFTEGGTGADGNYYPPYEAESVARLKITGLIFSSYE